MQTMPTVNLVNFGLRQLIGPLSDRELRVASRRTRSYALRTGYVILLCILLLSTWYRIAGRPSAGATFGVSRAAAVSTEVAGSIVLFHLVVGQLVAALMLCSSIGDELRRGTLSVLLTTPITSVHIVAGKLLGGLLQIVLLLGIGLPALAVLRVFGGLSWGDVHAASWITLTAAVFAGAVSLLLATYYRHPFEAISAGAVVYLVLFVALPFVAAWLMTAGVLNPPVTRSILDLTNPFRALYEILSRVWPFPMRATARFFSWPVHCLIMAAMAAVVSCVAARRIRRAAAGGLSGEAGRSATVHRLHGSPVAWKEDPAGRLLRRGTLLTVTVVLLVCVLTVVTKGATRNSLQTYLYYGSGALWLIGFLRLAMSAAGGITREKESGAWPVLLMTPLDESQILRGKVKAALRRNAVLLLSALAIEMCFLFSVADSEDRPVVMAYALVRLASVLFLLGAGLYFGVRLRTTTVAVTATLIAFLCVNYFIAGQYSPLSAWWLTRIIHSSAGVRSSTLLLYSLVMAGAKLALDVGLGLFLWHRACRNVRQYVF
jgi:ABC-type transport system involved in multi-copper enzyme maturation permease subunit